MCMTVRVHVCGWVAFSILERGIPSVDKKRGMLERSDKPWGANGGCEYLCACMYVFARALILQCGCTLPTSSGMRWGGGGSKAGVKSKDGIGDHINHPQSYTRHLHQCLSFPAEPINKLSLSSFLQG